MTEQFPPEPGITEETAAEPSFYSEELYRATNMEGPARTELMSQVALRLYDMQEKPVSGAILNEVDAIDADLEHPAFDAADARAARASIRAAGSNLYALGASEVTGNALGEQLTRLPYLEKARSLNAMAISDLVLLERSGELFPGGQEMKQTLWERIIGYDLLMGDMRAAGIDREWADRAQPDRAKALGQRAIDYMLDR